MKNRTPENRPTPSVTPGQRSERPARIAHEVAPDVAKHRCVPVRLARRSARRPTRRPSRSSRRPSHAPGHLGVVGDDDEGGAATLLRAASRRSIDRRRAVRVQGAGRLVGEDHAAAGGRARARRRRAGAARRRAGRGACRRRSASPSSASSSRQRCSWPSRRHASASWSATFSTAVRNGSRLSDWKTSPSCSRRSRARSRSDRLESSSTADRRSGLRWGPRGRRSGRAASTSRSRSAP